MTNFLNFIKHLPQIGYRLLLSISASAYVVVIYLIKEQIAFPFISLPWKFLPYLFYLLLPIAIAGGCLYISQYLPICDIGCKIKEVELASHSFLPNYLGYFFVALSIPNITTLFYVYAVILVFTHLSQALSFNPLFLIFKFQFYFVTGEDGTRIFLITKQKMKNYQDADLSNLRRLNDFTFIDWSN